VSRSVTVGCFSKWVSKWLYLVDRCLGLISIFVHFGSMMGDVVILFAHRVNLTRGIGSAENRFAIGILLGLELMLRRPRGEPCNPLFER